MKDVCQWKISVQYNYNNSLVETIVFVHVRPLFLSHSQLYKGIDR